MIQGLEVILIIIGIIYLFASNHKSPKKRWEEYEKESEERRRREGLL